MCTFKTWIKAVRLYEINVMLIWLYKCLPGPPDCIVFQALPANTSPPYFYQNFLVNICHFNIPRKTQQKFLPKPLSAPQSPSHLENLYPTTIFSPPLNSTPMSRGSLKGCECLARSRQGREPLWSRSCRQPLRDEATRTPINTCREMKAEVVRIY